MRNQKIYNEIRRIFNGALVGVGIGYLIALFFSVSYGDFLPATTALVNRVGILKAGKMLAFYSGLVGAVFSGTKFIWQIEKWNLLKRSIIYFAINLSVMYFSGYRMYWFSHNLKGSINFLIVFIVIFFSIWCTCYFKVKKDVKKMNERINELKFQNKDSTL